MYLGVSNRKFASIIFLLLAIIISLALSGLTIFLHDKKSSVLPILSESFEGYNLDETQNHTAGADGISLAGGPVSKHTEKGTLGEKILMKPMLSSDNDVEASSMETSHANCEKHVPVITSNSSASTKKQHNTIFERIFDFAGLTKPEAFSLRY
jgi:hypothetical protein